jgi:hypothetical protein
MNAVNVIHCLSMPNHIPLDEKRQVTNVQSHELTNVCDEVQQVALLSRHCNKTNEQHSFS